MGKFKIPEILTWCIFSPPFPRWSCCFPSLSEVWVLRGEHWVLAGLRGLQENQVTPEAHIKSKEDLQWLHWEGGSQRDKHRLPNQEHNRAEHPRSYAYLLQCSAEEGLQLNGEQLIPPVFGIRVLPGTVQEDTYHQSCPRDMSCGAMSLLFARRSLLVTEEASHSWPERLRYWVLSLLFHGAKGQLLTSVKADGKEWHC